jgi:RNA polymerase sigma-70 factor (ECF subfamily)
MYVVARNVALNRMRSRARKQRREVPLSAAPEVAGMMERVRTETAVHLKTETRDRFREIRDALDPDDRTLLILRIDRGLSWNETARVLADEEHVDDAELPRLAARLRKRFERLKAKVVAELRNAEVRATP